MGIDLTKLTPEAELSIEYDNDTGPGDEGFWEWWSIGSGRFTEEEEAKFHLLARRAFGIMQRRKWGAKFQGLGWFVCDAYGFNLEADGKHWVKLSDDPFTALCEAEDWWIANIEKGEVK